METFKRSRGETRRQIQAAIDAVVENPFLQTCLGDKGRLNGVFKVRNYIIDLTIDHPMKAVVVLRLVKEDG